MFKYEDNQNLYLFLLVTSSISKDDHLKLLIFTIILKMYNYLSLDPSFNNKYFKQKKRFYFLIRIINLKFIQCYTYNILL